jgi:hypothetical protein
VSLLIATDDGVMGLPGLEGHGVAAVAVEDGAVWAVVDRREVWRHQRDTGWWRAAVAADGVPDLTCIAAVGSGVLIGTVGAHIAHASADGTLRVDVDFDALDERATWYTPWGSPPDTRSIAFDGATGATLVNVHVGGVACRGGIGPGVEADAWRALVDIDVDVHQIVVAPDGSYLVATGAAGYGRSTDGGRTWRWDADGMHGSYCRAVAVTGDGDHVLVSASTGPSGGPGAGAIYRRPLTSTGAWERVTPMVDGNVDTGRLAGEPSGGAAAFATESGDVFTSADGGATWEPAPRPPAAVSAVAFS